MLNARFSCPGVVGGICTNESLTDSPPSSEPRKDCSVTAVSISCDSSSEPKMVSK